MKHNAHVVMAAWTTTLGRNAAQPSFKAILVHTSVTALGKDDSLVCNAIRSSLKSCQAIEITICRITCFTEAKIVLDMVCFLSQKFLRIMPHSPSSILKFFT
jgi:hypothetical protein